MFNDTASSSYRVVGLVVNDTMMIINRKGRERSCGGLVLGRVLAFSTRVLEKPLKS